VAAAGALLACYFILALTAVAEKCTTFDEPYHLAGGYTYWKFGDFRIHPENGNLPQRWAALPLLFGDYQFSSLDDQSWRTSLKESIAPRFLYLMGNEADDILRRGRAMIAVLGVVLGALVFGWTRRLLGLTAAFISLTLYVFCPTLLANGALATSDMTAALFFTAVVACLWSVLHRVTWQKVFLSALVMAGLFVAKFSAPMIIIVGALLVGVQIASRQPLIVSWGKTACQIHARRRRLLAHLAVLGIHAIVVWIVIWACYNFRYEMFHPAMTAVDSSGEQPVVVDTMQPSWDTLLENDGSVIDQFIVTSRELHFLPEAYLYGFAYARYFAQGRQAFLNGEFSTTGWPQFFPYCLLVKTPLTLLILLVLAMIAIWNSWQTTDDRSPRQHRARMIAGLYRAAPLWSLFLVYWAFAITSHLNIGHRHLLPTYPAMIILAGGSALWLSRLVAGKAIKSSSTSAPEDSQPGNGSTNWLNSRRHPALALISLGCVGLFVLESLWQWPNYLTYFNQSIGGQKYAYRHLVDSSLDWGQDLPALGKWLTDQGLDKSPNKVYLSYFGMGSPKYYGIDATWLPSGAALAEVVPKRFDEGTYCISATMLQSAYTAFPRRWNPGYEKVYQQLRANLINYNRTGNDPLARQRFLDQSGGQDGVSQMITSFHTASFARLCSYLRGREPDAEINYSILIYRLSRADLQRILEGPPSELTTEPPAATGKTR
jgi:hypothetical protein